MRIALLGEIVNRAMRPFGVELRRSPDRLSVWDIDFIRWIKEAKSRGLDPNDLGDAEWATDLLEFGLANVYGPLFRPEARILELGPGTGRLSRHAAGHDRHLTVVDRSDTVCDWMSEYLAGKGPHLVHQIRDASLPMVASSTIDAIVAHGVFEHLDLDVAYWFLVDFNRVLRPGGTVAFNFDNATSAGGMVHLELTSAPDRASVFRFHSPDTIRGVAAAAGYSNTDIFEDSNRIAFAACRK